MDSKLTGDDRRRQKEADPLLEALLSCCINQQQTDTNWQEHNIIRDFQQALETHSLGRFQAQHPYAFKRPQQACAIQIDDQDKSEASTSKDEEVTTNATTSSSRSSSTIEEGELACMNKPVPLLQWRETRSQPDLVRLGKFGINAVYKQSYASFSDECRKQASSPCSVSSTLRPP